MSNQRGTFRPFSRIVSYAAFALIAVGSPYSALADDDVSVRLNYFAAGYTAPFYVGIDKGFYKAVGLNVTVREGKGSGTTAAQVAAGQDTFGFVSPDALIHAVSQGAPIRTVASLAADAGYCVLVKENSGIQEPGDLAGKRYASTAQSSPGRMLSAYLSAAGVKPEEVKRLSIDAANLAGGFLNDQFEATAALAYDEQPKFTARGVPVRCLLYSAVGLKMLGPGIVTNQDMIDNHPDLVQRFVNATIKAYQYSFDHPEETAEIGKRFVSDSLSNEQSTVGQLIAFRAMAANPLGPISLKDLEATLVLIRSHLGQGGEVTDVRQLYSDKFVEVK